MKYGVEYGDSSGIGFSPSKNTKQTKNKPFMI